MSPSLRQCLLDFNLINESRKPHLQIRNNIIKYIKRKNYQSQVIKVKKSTQNSAILGSQVNKYQSLWIYRNQWSFFGVNCKGELQIQFYIINQLPHVFIKNGTLLLGVVRPCYQKILLIIKYSLFFALKCQNRVFKYFQTDVLLVDVIFRVTTTQYYQFFPNKMSR